LVLTFCRGDLGDLADADGVEDVVLVELVLDRGLLEVVDGASSSA
jgi:hypothetical protein